MASLSLLQGYSSSEEAENQNQPKTLSPFSDDDDDDDDEFDEEEEEKPSKSHKKPHYHHQNPPPNSSSSLLPSALDAFSEIAGPPDFLNNAVVGYGEGRDEAKEVEYFRGRRRNHREKKDLPAGVVVEAKAQLVGIRDRVRSDVEGSSPAPTIANTAPEVKRIVSASNPEAKDAADLLRMCLQCKVPKTYSHTRGMVCPICGDRPPLDPLKEAEKKKGSTIKDKEKNKRMKGQSSHATWKSETEMQLRQQFD